MVGYGPIARQAALDALEHASMTLVGTINNKLAWFSEQDRRSKTKPLPEYIRRAILAKSWHRCELRDCVRPADDVDHIRARCNQGINDPDNLQALCQIDHDEKTRIDAPWTVDGIYGKAAEKRKQEAEYADTG